MTQSIVNIFNWLLPVSKSCDTQYNIFESSKLIMLYNMSNNV